MTDQNGWSLYQIAILNRLDKLEEHHEKIDAKVTQVLIDIATLKVKSGLWGAAASGVVIIAAVVAKYVLGL